MEVRKFRAHALRATALAGIAAVIVGFGEYPNVTEAVGTNFTHPAETRPLRKADFRGVAPSQDARRIADWTLSTGDHEGLPFIVVDKRRARTYVFDERGALIEWTPALIGMGIGDQFESGVVEMNMYETKPSQRITPAGRFRAEEWQKPNGEWILWLDYPTQIAIHKLRKSQLALSQDREARLYSDDPRDSRVTFGCVNVPPAFYDRVITPTFNGRGGIVYVLPDERPIETFFELYPARARASA